MLNTRVLSLCVFTDKNSVDIIIWCLVSGDGNTWPNVGKKVECPSKGQVKGNVALSDFPVIISTQGYMVIDETYSVWPKDLWIRRQR